MLRECDAGGECVRKELFPLTEAQNAPSVLESSVFCVGFPQPDYPLTARIQTLSMSDCSVCVAVLLDNNNAKYFTKNTATNSPVP